MGFWEKFFGKKRNQNDAFSTVVSYRKDMQSAGEKGEKMIKSNPENPRGYYELAHNLQYEGNYGEAIENLNVAISLDTKFEDALQLRAELYQIMKNYNKALVDAQEVLRINPNNYKATYMVGNAFYKLNMLPEALEYFEKCKELDPTIVNTRNRISEIREVMLREVIKPLNLYSDDVFSGDDMNRIKEALKNAPILPEERIFELFPKEKYQDTMEGHLEQVLGRLTDFMLEDSKRPEFIGLRADWVNNEYVSVSTWLRPPNAAQATVWNLLIVRKSDDVFCLFA